MRSAQRSYEWGAKRRGFFSYQLEQGLKGAAADTQGRITLSGLVTYLRRTVPDNVQRVLGKPGAQTPFVRLEGGDPGNWVLIRASLPADPGQPDPEPRPDSETSANRRIR